MKPQPASRSSFHFQMKCLAPCSRLTPGDLDDTCRTLKPSFRRIFPASARLLLDHVWTPCDLRIKWLPFQPTTENVNVIIVLSRSNSAHLHPARPATFAETSNKTKVYRSNRYRLGTGVPIYCSKIPFREARDEPPGNQIHRPSRQSLPASPSDSGRYPAQALSRRTSLVTPNRGRADRQEDSLPRDFTFLGVV